MPRNWQNHDVHQVEGKCHISIKLFVLLQLKRQSPPQAGHHMPAPAARPPPGAGIQFAGLHSYPGDLVDNLTLMGFTFLEDLQDTNNLWTLRDVRIPRISPKGPKGEAQRAFDACFLLVLKLADRHTLSPNTSSATYSTSSLNCSCPAVSSPRAP